MKKRLFIAVISLLILAAFAMPTPALDAAAGLFQSPPPAESPANDNWAAATEIHSLPFSDSLDNSTATLEDGEPRPSCAYMSWDASVWYAYTPAESGRLTVRAEPQNGHFAIGLAAYTGDSLSNLLEVGSACDQHPNVMSVTVAANTAYYFQVGSAEWGSPTGWLSLQVEGAPPNDKFANATPIDGLPFGQYVSTWAASREVQEPAPSCVGGSWDRTVWYAYTPSDTSSLTAYVEVPEGEFEAFIAVYTGASLASLTEVGSSCGLSIWAPRVAFRPVAGEGYYFQVGGTWGDGGSLTVHLEVAPPPEATFWFEPGDPSVFDTVQFHNDSQDPAGGGIESWAWDLGDGATSAEWSPTHRYAADGDYTVQLTVTTYDGRYALTTQVVAVRTHDVAIAKLAVPKAAKAGQTREMHVGIKNQHYPEEVLVDLYRSVPGGEWGPWELVDSLSQSVPVHLANRTTDFGFDYTFTAADARAGKVTFRAVASVLSAREALPADNEAIATPTKVTQ